MSWRPDLREMAPLAMAMVMVLAMATILGQRRIMKDSRGEGLHE